MGRERHDIGREIYSRLYSMYTAGRGRSRHEDKKTGDDVRFIYSSRTYRTYRDQGKAFAAYAKAQGLRNLDQAREVVPGRA